MSLRIQHWLAMAALAIAQYATAATYYVNASDGDDTAQGQAQVNGPSDGPWRTLARASAHEYRNGDELLLRCGQTHRGQLVLRVAQGAGQLRVSGYGDCPAEQLPRIDGTASVPTTLLNGRRSSQLPFEPGRVLQNGTLLPRSFAVSRVIADPVNRDMTQFVPPLPTGADMGHAIGYARTRDWLVEPVRFQGNAWAPVLGGTRLQYPIAAGTMLAITGKAWVLRDSGWIFDAQNRQLLVAGIGDVAVAKQAPLLQISGAGSVLVDKLQLDYAGEDAIQINIRGTAAIRGCLIMWPARRGISLESASSVFVVDNRIAGAGEDAIHVVSTPRATVLRNTVTDTGTLEPLQPAFGAINVSRAKAALVAENKVERSAYVGIRFGEGAEIASNIVVDSCRRLSDCAAIYTWQKSPSPTRQPSTVAGNLIVGVYGNADVKLGFRVWAAGIYLDDFSSNITVSDNAVFGARQGLYFHNAYSIRADKNLSVGDRETSVSFQLDTADNVFRAMPNLDVSLTNHTMLPARAAASLSVVRRILSPPFTRFEAVNMGPLERKISVSWYENIGTFESPTYRRELEVPALVWQATKGIQQLAHSDTPESTNWTYKKTGNGYQVSSERRIFNLQKADSELNAKCTKIGQINSSAIDSSMQEVVISDCGL